MQNTICHSLVKQLPQIGESAYWSLLANTFSNDRTPEISSRVHEGWDD